MNRHLIFLLPIVFLVGCTTSDLQEVDSNVDRRDYPAHPLSVPRKANNDPVYLKYLSCDHNYYNWMDDLQLNAAAEGYAFALMCSNVYRDVKDPYYQIPDWQLQSRHESPSGLTFDIYQSEMENKYAFVYRGTDTKLNDWLTNIAIVEPNQYREAYQELAGFVLEHPGAEIIVTGHSLGGGIALNMAQRVENVTAIAFNASPRAFYKRNAEVKNRLVHIFEAGEALAFLNRGWLILKIDGLERYRYNYLDFYLRTISPVHEHSMYRLSRGLLISAVHQGDESALEAFRVNVDICDECDPEFCEQIRTGNLVRTKPEKPRGFFR